MEFSVHTGLIYNDSNVMVTAIENTHFDFKKIPTRPLQ